MLVRASSYNSNKSPTWCNNLPVYYPDVCLQLNMFRAFYRPSSGAQWLQWQPLVLPSYRGDSRVVFVVGPAGRPARPRTQHDYHHDTKVKPETATAVIELLMMGGKTPETCWAVNKRQDNKLKNCCIRLVIYLNFMLKVKVLNCSLLNCSLVNVTLVWFISLEWVVCVLFSMLCLVCVHFISASNFFYWVSGIGCP